MRRRRTTRSSVIALWSTVADLQRFLDAQLEPPDGTLREAIRLTHRVRVPGRRMDVCLGWFRLHARGEELWWHNGGTAGYRSFVAVRHQPACAVAVVSASNRSVDELGFA